MQKELKFRLGGNMRMLYPLFLILLIVLTGCSNDEPDKTPLGETREITIIPDAATSCNCGDYVISASGDVEEYYSVTNSLPTATSFSDLGTVEIVEENTSLTMVYKKTGIDKFLLVCIPKVQTLEYDLNTTFPTIIVDPPMKKQYVYIDGASFIMTSDGSSEIVEYYRW